MEKGRPMDHIELDLFPDLLLPNSPLNLDDDFPLETTTTMMMMKEEGGKDENDDELGRLCFGNDWSSSSVSSIAEPEKGTTSTNGSRPSGCSTKKPATILTVKLCKSNELFRQLNEIPISRSNVNLTDDGKHGGISKNAIAARENRLKKKRYLEDLENSNKQLQLENKQLKLESKEKAATIESLTKENAYLCNVIANATELSSLLKNIRNTPEVRVRVSNSMLGQSPLEESGHGDEDEPTSRRQVARPRRQKQHANKETVGVCLHVSDKKVSVEFCAQCCENAKETWKE